MPGTIDDRIEVIAPNLKRRLSGVTATIARLLPVAGPIDRDCGNRTGAAGARTICPVCGL